MSKGLKINLSVFCVLIIAFAVMSIPHLTHNVKYRYDDNSIMFTREGRAIITLNTGKEVVENYHVKDNKVYFDKYGVFAEIRCFYILDFNNSKTESAYFDFGCALYFIVLIGIIASIVGFIIGFADKKYFFNRNKNKG